MPNVARLINCNNFRKFIARQSLHYIAGKIEGDEVEVAIHKYVQPMLDQGVDTIVLGCTHYPFLKPCIHRLYPRLNLIDTGSAVAKQVIKMLPSTKSDSNSTTIILETTGDKDKINKAILKSQDVLNKERDARYVIRAFENVSRENRYKEPIEGNRVFGNAFYLFNGNFPNSV